MAVKGTQRGTVFSDGELRSEVRKACLIAFAKRIGVPWDERWEVRLGYEPNYPTPRQVAHRGRLDRRRNQAASERKARIICERLREAIRDALDFSARDSDGGQAASFLGRWVPDHIASELVDMIPTKWANNPDDARGLLVVTLDSYDVFHQSDALGGGSSFLDARDFAIVSLLVGNWPASVKPAKHGTVASVLALETAGMQHHVKKYGVLGHGPTTPDSGQAPLPKRGPKHRPNTKHEK